MTALIRLLVTCGHVARPTALPIARHSLFVLCAHVITAAEALDREEKKLKQDITERSMELQRLEATLRDAGPK